MEFNFFSPTAFPTSIGPWGELFARFYDQTRSEIENELSFWLTQTSCLDHVTEIGSGTGFISSHLVRFNRHTHFNFVEPEKENTKLLEKNIIRAAPNCSSRYQIHPCRFEEADISPQDLIIFPYDSLPMITLSEQRLNIFNKAFGLLKDNGKFIIHISTKKFAESDIQKHNEVVTTSISETNSNALYGSRLCRQISRNEYIKYISIKNHDNSKVENYIARTSIVTPEEIKNLASAVGFEIENIYSDFYLNTNEDSYDLIFVMRK